MLLYFLKSIEIFYIKVKSLRRGCQITFDTGLLGATFQVWNHMYSIIHMSKPNERSCRFSGFSGRFPPLLTGLSSKCHNVFSIWSLLSLEKYVRQKYSLCLFSKNFFWVCLFPTIFTSFFQKIESFLPKITYIGGKQTNYKKNFKWKIWMFRCFFIRWLY